MYQSLADFGWRVNHVQRLISSCLQNLCSLDSAWGWGWGEMQPRCPLTPWVRQCQTAPTLTQVLTHSFLLPILYLGWTTNQSCITFGYLLNLRVQCHQGPYNTADTLGGLFEHVPDICLFHLWRFFFGKKTKLPALKLFLSAGLWGFPNYRMLE
jgi:hypothetical protein